MALVDQKKKNQNRITKTKGMQLPGTSSLASIESLAIPLVQEVVFLADFRCAKCQQRVAEAMAKMNGKGFFLTTTLSCWLFVFSLSCIQIKRTLSPTLPADVIKFTVAFFPKMKNWKVLCIKQFFHIPQREKSSGPSHWIPFCNYFWSSYFLELPFGFLESRIFSTPRP